MGKQKKKFNKNAPGVITFKLLAAPTVHDGGEEGTVAGGAKAPSRVFARYVPPNAEKKGKYKEVPEELRRALGLATEDGTDCVIARSTVPHASKPKEEDLLGDCYFPLDGYDYSQHLAPIGGGDGVFISSDATPQTVVDEETVDLKKVSKDVREVLLSLHDANTMEAEGVDENDDFPDDFVTIAQQDEETGVVLPVNQNKFLWGAHAVNRPSDEALTRLREILKARGGLDDKEDDDDWDFEGDGAVNLGTIDDREFERVLAEYDDDEIGELSETDENVLMGTSEAPRLIAAAVQEWKERSDRYTDVLPGLGTSADDELGTSPTVETQEGMVLLQRTRDDELQTLEHIDSETVNKIRELVEFQERREGHDFKTILVPDIDEVGTKNNPRWDCESAISARSTTSNRPARVPKARMPRVVPKAKATAPLPEIPEMSEIGPITLDSRLDVPIESIPSHLLPKKLREGITWSKEEDEENSSDDGNSSDSDNGDVLPEIITKRNRGESSEEKRARQAAVKQAKRLIRESKRQNKQIHKEEASRQRRIDQSNAYDVPKGVRRFRVEV